MHFFHTTSLQHTSGPTSPRTDGTNLVYDMQSNPYDNHHNKQNQKQTNKNYCMLQKANTKENSQPWTQEVKDNKKNTV
jgi:hypothetical protein